MPKLRSHLNTPTVLAALALFVALAGSSFAAPAREAASKLISGKQIKNGSIASTDIKNNSVGSKDIKNGSLLKKDFKAGQLPAGATGPRGLAGAAGGTGRLTYVFANVDLAASENRKIDAVCPPGQYATGRSVEPPDDSTFSAEGPDFATGNRDRGEWTAFIRNGATEAGASIVVVCAPGPQPVAPL